MAQLLIQGNAGNTIVHDLHPGINSIGRFSSNDVILYDDGVSGHHAQIEYLPSVFMVRDLDSSNGTRVNGTRYEESELRDGDIVSFGPVKCAFVTTARVLPEVAPPSPPVPEEPAPAVMEEDHGGLLGSVKRLFGRK